MSPSELIEAISWYRDQYHHTDFGHTEMIERLKPLVGKELSESERQLLETFEQAVDGWLDIETSRAKS